MTCIVLLILNPDNRWVGDRCHDLATYSLERTQATNVKKVGLAPGLVWIGIEKKQISRSHHHLKPGPSRL
jgi:hypothetical protein